MYRRHRHLLLWRRDREHTMLQLLTSPSFVGFLFLKPLTRGDRWCLSCIFWGFHWANWVGSLLSSVLLRSWPSWASYIWHYHPSTLQLPNAVIATSSTSSSLSKFMFLFFFKKVLVLYFGGFAGGNHIICVWSTCHPEGNLLSNSSICPLKLCSNTGWVYICSTSSCCCSSGWCLF